jgi:hypothetical protein
MLLMAALMSGFVFATVSPTLGAQFGKLIDVSVIFCLLMYIFACASVWHYARVLPAVSGLRRYRPAAAAAIAFCLLVILYSDTPLLILSASMLVLAYPLFRLYRLISRNAATAPIAS